MTDSTTSNDQNSATTRSGARLWAKGRTKVKAVVSMSGMLKSGRKRSIFGNQFGKGDLLEDMPEIHIDRQRQPMILNEDDNDNHIFDTSDDNVVGWNEEQEDNNHTPTIPQKYADKGYKTNVRASINKLKKAAKKVRRFLTTVRLAHDPTCQREPLSYRQVLQKLREHYDPDGIHSEKHADQHEYYTDLGLLKRESLKFHPKIRALLDQLWQAADKNGDGGLDKEEYLTMCSKVYKAIVDDSDDPEDQATRDQIAEEDWEADSQGHLTLDYRRFTTAWFQLADHWTHDLNVEAYCRFLGQIKDTVTHIVNGRIIWKDDSNIAHMEIEDPDAKVKVPKETEEDEIVVRVVVKKKVKEAPPLLKKKSSLKKIVSAPKLTKPKEKKAMQPVNSMVLQEGNPDDKRRNLARMASTNGLFRGSTVPPPKGWSATKTNKWGITFTRIKMKSDTTEQEEVAQSLGVRASLSSPLRQPRNPHHHNMGGLDSNFHHSSESFHPNVSGSSSYFIDDETKVPQHLQSQYHPSASGGFQSSKFRYPQAYDATVGAIGGGFEWNNPVAGDGGNSAMAGGGSELLRPSWVSEVKRQRPSTAHATSSALHANPHGSQLNTSGSWIDQLQRPSTASGYLPSQATLTLVPADTFANMLEAGGSSLFLQSHETMGSMMLDSLQHDLMTPIRKRNKKKKKKKKVKRPKTAPGKPRELRFDRNAQGGTSTVSTQSPKRSRQRRSKSPPNQRTRSKSPPKSDSKKVPRKVTRMRQRLGTSNLLSPAGIPQPMGSLEPLIRPMTTGGIRQKKSRKAVKIKSGGLFRNSVSRPSSALAQQYPEFKQTTKEENKEHKTDEENTLDMSMIAANESKYSNWGGSRILDPTELRGLPTSARTLMNQYAGYDPMASLTQASLSIGGHSMFGASSFSTMSLKETSTRNRRGRGRGGRRRNRSGQGKHRGRNGFGVGTTGGEGSSMSLSVYMNKLVPSSRRTIKLLKLREDCTVDDIVGVMLAVGAAVAPQDVTLSDVSSKTRLRRASVRFGKYKDYKLALKMLAICNRAEEQQGKVQHRSRRQPEVMGVLWGKDSNSCARSDEESATDGFGATKLTPVQRVKLPRTLREMLAY